MSIIETIKLKVYADERGFLVPIESKSSIPFDVERVYYIYNIQSGASRGFHAHKKLQQFLIAISGKCTVILDNGYKREKICLDTPSIGLLIKNMIWREIYDFSKDCIILVLASQNYDETDYIKEYKKFVELVSKKSV
jgi:dTDP-4-dehydrorhamnose 3,5-epimerase-like enzyme